MRPYHLRYSMEPGRFTKADVKDGVHGLCDALVAASVLFGDDGSMSISIFNGDGRTRGPVDDRTKFHVLLALAESLAESPTILPALSELAGRFVADAHDAICDAGPHFGAKKKRGSR